MIAIVTLVVLVSAYLIVNALSRTNAELTNTREQRNMNTLLQAKAALIAYAASEQWQLYKGQSIDQPGALPCPDQDDDGDGDCFGSATSSMIGRLPWKTIGADDLRDSTGERVWYALSHNFRKNPCPGTGCTTINSDTQGQLTITGTAPASNVVAIVFAPGLPIQGQNRTTGHNNAAAYLEAFNLSDPVNYIFTSNASPSDTLNDRLVAITQADLMAAVEPVVAARIERDVKPYLQSQFTQWGGFPFPAKFAPDAGGPGDNSNAPSSPTPHPRAQSQYQGDPTQTSGLLPITASLGYSWLGSGSVSLISGSNTGVVSSISCTTVASSSDSPPTGHGWQCTFTLGPATFSTSLGFSFFCFCTRYTTTSTINNPRINVQGDVDNAAISFAQLPDVSRVGNSYTPTTPAINGVLVGPSAGTAKYQATYSSLNCSITTPPQNFSAPPPPFPPCPSYTLKVTIPDVTANPVTSTATIAVTAASNASPIAITTNPAHNFSTGQRLTIAGVGGNTAANGTWTITVVDSTHFTLSGSTGSGAYTSGGTVSSAAAWFVLNEWYRQTYYAASTGYLPGGPGACNPLPGTPSCLTVNNIASPNNDKRAILVLAGRALDGSTRPSANLSGYLEGENLTPADSIFEHRQGSPTSINDRVVVLSP